MKPRRDIVIGDVHGCIEELDELLRVVDYRSGSGDRLLFTGDLLDRGPDPVGVVRRARELGADCVLGNHEEKHVRWARWEAKITSGEWKKKNPMRPFDETRLAQHNALNEADLEYLRAMPKLLVIDDTGWVVVHAGFECDGTPIDEQSHNTVCRVRDLDPEGKMSVNKENLFEPAPGSIPWAEHWMQLVEDGQTPFRVIYGHNVQSLEKPTIYGAEYPTSYGIDTGCVFGGRLTAWVRTRGAVSCVETVQVQAKERYYPISKGATYGTSTVADLPGPG